ncbi:hypothetical protein J2T09_000729 [Neorhizobium huautlense]|uniref:Uncharacterized protein n=1 Tax=Neorhizobium huautlense TaxID=67774 RepID=A0ABT9PNH3_9HYPH|nr:hypothetical protein [Neorhizobium huautlense]
MILNLVEEATSTRQARAGPPRKGGDRCAAPSSPHQENCGITACPNITLTLPKTHPSARSTG